MNQTRLQSPGDHAIVATVDARMDLRQQDIVECGIAMQRSSNTMSAFEYLRSRDVDQRVIERVLLYPQRRRLFQ
jgi:hypothetical protein